MDEVKADVVYLQVPLCDPHLSSGGPWPKGPEICHAGPEKNFKNV